MKNFIGDVAQVIAAIVLTTGMVVANAESPKINEVVTKSTPSVSVVSKPSKLPAQHIATAVPVPKPTVAPTPQPEAPKQAPVQAQAFYSGSHEDWMAQAGISAADYAAVDYIVTRESGWNPNATNASSGAHGLPQALPYSKTGCGWVDPICQLRWANGYATSRYGGWWAAQAFWSANHYW